MAQGARQLILFDGAGHQVGDVFAHHRNPKYTMTIVEICDGYFKLLCPDGNHCYLYGSLIDSMLKISQEGIQ